MSRRLLLLVAAVALVAVLTLYMTGVIIGDPFPGTWKADQGSDNRTLVIRHTADGYELSLVGSGRPAGWVPATRSRNVLTADTGDPIPTRFVFQPWSRHITQNDTSADGLVFNRVRDIQLDPLTSH